MSFETILKVFVSFLFFLILGQQLSPDSKEYFMGNTRMTPTEGSTRSDEGYHSNGFHDDHLTPPEDSSDSDIDNYVLDLRAVKSKKLSSDKEKEKTKAQSTQVLLITFKSFDGCFKYLYCGLG